MRDWREKNTGNMQQQPQALGDFLASNNPNPPRVSVESADFSEFIVFTACPMMSFR